jgi:uncharacterized protein with HEPN domain
VTDDELVATILDALHDATLIIEPGRRHFLTDPIAQRAAKNIIAEIGEAAAQVSDQARERASHVPWRLIIGMRHKVVHDYASVDLSVLWDTLGHDLPALAAALRHAR